MTVEAPRTPRAEVEITEELIARLVASQFPDFARLPIRIIGTGWDNVVARVGNFLAARIPRHAVGEMLLMREQKWLPELAPKLPLPIPSPIHIGAPIPDYPFTWSIVPWIEGECADIARPMASEAEKFVQFVKALHVPAPSNAPTNSARDCPLSGKQVDTERRMSNIAHRCDLLTPKLKNIWEKALSTEIDVPQTWIAADIHARNVITRRGQFAAFIDWGDMCAGDRATDLAGIWNLFEEPHARRAAIESCAMSEATLQRSKGWAIFFGVILLETGLQDNSRDAAMGEATLRRLNEDS